MKRLRGKVEEIEITLAASNTGPVIIHNARVVTLMLNGKPLEAGDVRAGDEIEFNPFTGEITKVRRRKAGKKR